MKNFLRVHSLLMLSLLIPSFILSMENDNKKNLIEESMIITPIPTKRGLGMIRSGKDWIWNEEENLYHDLVDKTFDPTNSSYPKKLDSAIQIYVTKNNSQRIIEILEQCHKNYPRQIKINDGVACMTHKLLVEENKTKQSTLKKTIEDKERIFIEQENVLLNQLKQSVTSHINEMRQLYDKNLQEQDTIVKEQCNDIRKVKTALVTLHKTNKELRKNPELGYCSDSEKNPENIQNSYNDEYVLEKIEIAKKIEQTRDKVNTLLADLLLLEYKMNLINPL